MTTRAVWAGIFDRQIHAINPAMPTEDYPLPPGGPGGRWGWTLCGEVAWEVEPEMAAAYRRLWPPCAICTAREAPAGPSQ